MRICVLDHHGKAALIIRALRDQGFDVITEPSEIVNGQVRVILDFEVLLLDSDSPHSVPAWKFPFAREAARRGIPIVLYPHGANPDLDYDGIRPMQLPVSMILRHGEGHTEIYRRIGLQVPVRGIGWSYCEMVDPAPTGRVDRLLFAPIHPWADGKTIMPAYQAANEQAYEAFLAHPAKTKTVRVWGDLEAAGIYEQHIHKWKPSSPDSERMVCTGCGVGTTYCTLRRQEEPPEITYVGADAPQVEQIDAHDAVLSYGTFAYMALARGKPTVMYGQDIPPQDDQHTVTAANWGRYRDYMRYPVDTLDGFGEDVAEWRRLFVGEPLDPVALADAVRSVRPNRATRRRLVRA